MPTLRPGLGHLLRSLRRNARNTSYTPTEAWASVKTKKRTYGRPFLVLVAIMPFVSFGLGCWQVQRLKWKQNLIASAETQLSKPALELPANLDPDAVEDFDYRRVSATGHWNHNQEMLVSPRLHEGKMGYYVVTPLVRKQGKPILVNRGWIDQEHGPQSTRPESLEKGEVTVVCLLRKKPIPNNFTPDSRPEQGEYYFMDIDEMARRTGSQNVYMQAVSQGNLMEEQKAMRGIPLGFPPKIEFRNTHFQYILTWYGLSLATAIMLWSMIRQNRRVVPGHEIKRKLDHLRKWQ